MSHKLDLYYKYLDTAIPINNPASPSVDDYFEAFSKHYTPALNSNNRVINTETGVLEPLPYDMGLKHSMPKLNVDTGELVDISAKESHFLSSQGADIRVVSDTTIKSLGLMQSFRDEIDQVAGEKEAFLAGAKLNHVHGYIFAPTLTEGYYSLSDPAPVKRPEVLNDFDVDQSNYNQLVKTQGYLFSTDIDERLNEFLDIAAQANNPKIPSFDDAKYEPQFNKLEQYFKYFDLASNQSSNVYFTGMGPDFDYEQQEYNMSKGGLAFSKHNLDIPWQNITRSPFAQVQKFQYQHRNQDDFFDAHVTGLKHPAPRHFRSENDFLKLGAHNVTNYLFNKAIHAELNSHKEPNNFPIKFDDIELNKILRVKDGKVVINSKGELAKDLAGTMFAAHFGVPLTQNEVNRFNSHFNSNMFPKDDAQLLLGIAARVVDFAKSIDLTKDIHQTPNSRELWSDIKEDIRQRQTVKAPTNLWQEWKQDRAQYAIQMATPSLPELAKAINKELVKMEDIVTAVGNFVYKKSQSLSNKQELEQQKDNALNKGKER